MTLEERDRFIDAVGTIAELLGERGESVTVLREGMRLGVKVQRVGRVAEKLCYVVGGRDELRRRGAQAVDACLRSFEKAEAEEAESRFKGWPPFEKPPKGGE